MSNELEATLKNIPKLLREREEQLDKREEELLRLKKSLEEDYPNLGRGGDVLRLNVGGTRVDVLRRTLTQIVGSMLASRFSGRWDDNLENDADGNFLIDQPADLWLPMLNFLRDRSSETPLAGKAKVPPDATVSDKDRFYRMVNYYGMTLGVYPVSIYRLEGSETNYTTTLMAEHPEYKVRSDDLTSFFLVPKLDANDQFAHNRYVQSFEVVLGKNTTAQIGWASWRHRGGLHTVSAQGKGVGYGTCSFALDCGRLGMAVQQGFGALRDGVSITEGSVVRCENKGDSWYVDGHLVASSVQPASEHCISIGKGQVSNPMVPCVSVKGSLEFTTIELQFF